MQYIDAFKRRELRSDSLHESFLNYYVQVKRGWGLMRVEKREFAVEFSQLSCPGQTRMRVDESWEARVCMRVFSTIISWLNEDESWWELRSDSLHESFLNYYVQVKRGWELMRVEKREFAWEFSQLSCPGQTRMRVDESWEARVCMRVFSTIISWLNEDESWWELRSDSLHESFLNYYVQVKRGWELRREILCESSLNSHVLLKRGWESWKARVCMRVFLYSRSLDKRRWELLRVRRQEFT